MPALEELTHTFKHPWKDISLATWFKYPNPSRPDVLCVDMLNREFDADTGVLRIRRLLTLRVAIPFWLEKITGGARCFFVEDAVIDPNNNRMELTGKNVSWSQLVEMKEHVTYSTSSENKDWTHMKQEAKVSVFSFGLQRKVEDICIKNFKDNAWKGRELMEQAITKVRRELLAVEEFGNKLKLETEELLIENTQKIGLQNALAEQ